MLDTADISENIFVKFHKDWAGKSTLCHYPIRDPGFAAKSLFTYLNQFEQIYKDSEQTCQSSAFANAVSPYNVIFSNFTSLSSIYQLHSKPDTNISFQMSAIK